MPSSRTSRRSLSRVSAGGYRPPPFRPNIIVRHKFRFTCLATGTNTVSGRDILGAIGVTGTVTNTTVKTDANAFRLLLVEVWSTPATFGVPVSCSLNWIGGQSAPPIQISDTSNSNQPAHIRCVPPRNSTPSFWQEPVTTDQNLFILNNAVGAIVDMTVEYVLGDETATLAVGVATAVVGTRYYLHLDGPGTHNYLPTGMISTF